MELGCAVYGKVTPVSLNGGSPACGRGGATQRVPPLAPPSGSRLSQRVTVPRPSTGRSAGVRLCTRHARARVTPQIQPMVFALALTCRVRRLLARSSPLRGRRLPLHLLVASNETRRRSSMLGRGRPPVTGRCVPTGNAHAADPQSAHRAIHETLNRDRAVIASPHQSPPFSCKSTTSMASPLLATERLNALSTRTGEAPRVRRPRGPATLQTADGMVHRSPGNTFIGPPCPRSAPRPEPPPGWLPGGAATTL
jgi:hypothetical protein